ncbi:MAG: lytic transglycosylase domain-containing protein [Armatimonadetes bacterium]|nr:lytic transglycosylase domain-containing protein [Armatimonadota bacterium]
MEIVRPGSGCSPVRPRQGRAARRLAAVVAAAVVGALLVTWTPGPAVAGASAFDEARAAFAAGRVAEAAAKMERHLRAAPNDPLGLLWLGVIRLHLRQGPEALRLLARSATLRATPDAYFWMGAAYAAMSHNREAYQALAKAAQLAPASDVGARARMWMRRLRVTSVRIASTYENPEEYYRIIRLFNPTLSRPTQVAIVHSLLHYSYKYRIDPRFVAALIVVESGFDVHARSPAGAYGLGQLMPATWQSLGIDPADPVGNIYGAVRWLRGLFDRFGEERYDLVLAAYNAGRGAVARHGGVPPFDETRWYVLNVLGLFRQFRGET